jgi:hypothetical protein
MTTQTNPKLNETVSLTFDQLVQLGWKMRGNTHNKATKGTFSLEVDLGASSSISDISFELYDKNSSNPEGFIGATFYSQSESPQNMAQRIDQFSH